MLKTRAVAGVICALAASAVVNACGSSSKATSKSTGQGAAVSPSCTPKHQGLHTIKGGVLTVAAYVSPPYTIQDGDAINGIDGTIIQRLAKMECLKADITSVAGAALPQTVLSGRADVAIGGVYYSKQRAATFDLTTPLYRDGLSLLSRDGVNSLQGLSHTTLGAIQGYLWNAEFQKALGSKVKLYQTSAALVSDIKDGRVGAGAFTSAEAGLRARQDGLKAAAMQPTSTIPQSLTKSNVVLLLNKHATPLTDALNADIKVLLGNGTIAGALKSNGVDPSLAATGS